MDFTYSNAFVKSSQNSEISVPKMATDNLAWPMTMSALAYVTRAMSKGGGVLVNVPEWGCFSIFRRADDVTRTMSKSGAWECSQGRG